MAKSVRSKIRRRHRSEFRKTIGTEAYDATQAKVNAKLMECITKQTASQETVDRLKSMFGTADEKPTHVAKMEDGEDGPSAVSKMLIEDSDGAAFANDAIVSTLSVPGVGERISKTDVLKGENIAKFPKAPSRQKAKALTAKFTINTKKASKKAKAARSVKK